MHGLPARSALVLSIVLLLGTGHAGAAEPSAETAGFEPTTLAARLGSPATAEAVTAVIEEARQRGPAASAQVATALGASGGVAAVDGLISILRSREPVVRMRAMEALVRTRLRTARLPRALSRRIGMGAAEERIAAIATLAAVGDGRDLETLLGLTDHRDEKTREAAFRGLRALTGSRLPDVTSRWAQWWKQAEARAHTELRQAIDAIEAGDKPARLPVYRGIVRRQGWMDLPFVESVLRDWLRDQDVRLKAEACDLVRVLRLADLGREVESALKYGRDPRMTAAAEACLDALGIPQRD